MLDIESRETRVANTKSGSNKTLKAVKVAISSALNMFCRIAKMVAGSVLQAGFKKPRRSNRLASQFTETGLVGMLEGAGFDFVDEVLFLVGATVDECCVFE